MRKTSIIVGCRWFPAKNSRSLLEHVLLLILWISFQKLFLFFATILILFDFARFYLKHWLVVNYTCFCLQMLYRCQEETSSDCSCFVKFALFRKVLCLFGYFWQCIILSFQFLGHLRKVDVRFKTLQLEIGDYQWIHRVNGCEVALPLLIERKSAGR